MAVAKPLFTDLPFLFEPPSVAAVPPAEAILPPWQDDIVDGFHGRIAIRQTHGEGLPLILIHGNSSSKEVFQHQMSGALGARHRLIALDLPGHGGSDNAADPDEGYSVAALADAVVDTAERLGLDRFAVLGWSLGGHIALEVAAGAPGVAGVMIVGTPPIGGSVAEILSAFQPGPVGALGGKPDWSDAEVAIFAEASGLAPHPDLTAALKRADGQARVRVFQDVLTGGATDERAIVASLSVPLAIVNGANDPVVQRAYVESLPYSSLWEGRFHTFPHAGHAPFLEAPELFNATLARFLHDLEQSEVAPQLCLAG